MKDTDKDIFEEAKHQEMQAYGYQGKPLNWQQGFDKGFQEGWNARSRMAFEEKPGAWKYRYVNRTGDFISPWFPVLEANIIEKLQEAYPQNEHDIEVVAFYAPTIPPKRMDARAIPHSRDWVNCPICGEPDMRKESDEDGNALIFCVNHGCASNGGGNQDGLQNKQNSPEVSAFNFALERAQLVDLINGFLGKMALKIDTIALAQKIMATRIDKTNGR